MKSFVFDCTKAGVSTDYYGCEKCVESLDTLNCWKKNLTRAFVVDCFVTNEMNYLRSNVCPVCHSNNVFDANFGDFSCLDCNNNFVLSVDRQSRLGDAYLEIDSKELDEELDKIKW